MSTRSSQPGARGQENQQHTQPKKDKRRWFRNRLLQGGCPGVPFQIRADLVGMGAHALVLEVDDFAVGVHEVGILVHEYHVVAQALILGHDDIFDPRVIGLHERIVDGRVVKGGKDARNKQ